MQREEALFLEDVGKAPAVPDAPTVIRELAAEAGITINGDAPWDIQIRDERVY